MNFLNLYNWIGIICIISSLIIPYRALSQCDKSSIGKAKANYEIGLFTEAINELTQCIDNRAYTENSIYIDAFRILANTYIVLDNMDKARYYVGKILDLNPGFSASSLDPFLFRRLVDSLKQKETSLQISSVSKKAEDIGTVPATVMVITKEDIQNRGYTDLEMIFNDLPGFDISRTYATTYSNLYQRGYRSSSTNRTLFMINGIEENDFWGNLAHWSQQFPVTNVKQIEIVYGPASTMYGANAFLGVVNVITNDSEKLKDNKRLGIKLDMGYGDFNTRYGDVTVTGSSPKILMSATAKMYWSDEMDFSPFPEYDYNPDDYNDVDYASILNREPLSEQQQSAYDSIPNINPLFQIIRGDSMEVKSIILNQVGLDSALMYDKAALADTLNGHPIGFANLQQRFYLKGLVKINDVEFGYQTWHNKQGNATFGNDNSRPGAKNGGVWRPTQSVLYSLYKKDIIEYKLSLSNTAQYRISSVTDGSNVVSLRNYSNRSLTAADLFYEKKPFWRTQYFYQIAKQFRNEVRMTYVLNKVLDLVGGIEYRHSNLQGDYLRTTIDTASVAEIGVSSLDDLPGGNNFTQRNLGAYLQGTYQVKDLVRITMGGRVDNSKIRQTEGYGTVFNPRVALVLSPGKFVIKGIVASAFQDASNRDKYSIAFPSRLINNPDLEPERVWNYEGVLGYTPSKDFHIEATAYYSYYSNLISQVQVEIEEGPNKGIITGKNENVGKLKIYGLQTFMTYTINDRYKIYANYSYTNPQNEIIDSTDQASGVFQRVGDIAAHKFNVGLNARLWEDRLNLNVRYNYVGSRPVGEGTSVPRNPQPGGMFPAVSLLNATLTVRNIIPGFNLQIIGNNLLDASYFHPGIRQANGISQSYRTPQKGRYGMLRLLYDFAGKQN